MPLIEIKLLQGRTEEQIQAVIFQVTQAIVSTLDVPKENVRVLVSEIPQSHWGIAGQVAKKIDR